MFFASSIKGLSKIKIMHSRHYFDHAQKMIDAKDLTFALHDSRWRTLVLKR